MRDRTPPVLLNVSYRATPWHSPDSKDEPKPDAFPTAAPYGWTMSEALERSLGKNASVTVEAAARLVDVDVETIRHWSDIGSIEIEQRGEMDVVRLDRVRMLTDSSRAGTRGTRYGLLRALLRDAPKTETPSVVVLQEIAREKAEDRVLTWDLLPPRYASVRRR